VRGRPERILRIKWRSEGLVMDMGIWSIFWIVLSVYKRTLGCAWGHGVNQCVSVSEDMHGKVWGFLVSWVTYI
jgi:hypothetical protein